MSAQQLKRVEDECARLEQELKRLDEAIHTKEACEQFMDYVLNNEEPFGQHDDPVRNPWANSRTNKSCCVVS